VRGASYDVAVVGGGILGLSTARQLLIARPGLRLIVLEKERELATHQTGHNSGVLHSGVYYAPGSLKARLCVEGKAALERFAAERGIPVRRAGKLIVALDDSELARLGELKRRATENGVEGLRELSRDEFRELEPNVEGIRALHAPSTGVIDYSLVAHAFAEDVRERGGEISLGRRVDAIRSAVGGAHLETDEGSLRARVGVSCAGLQSDRLAREGATGPRLRIVPFRGDYYTLTAAAQSLVNGLVYPVPDPAFPFLGVHFTKRIDGSVIAGPNAVLALSRERYRRAAFNVRDATSAVTYGGLWRFAIRHFDVAAAEVWRDLSKRAFVRDMQRYVPSVRGRDVEFGPTGIRAQALTPDGRLVDDFVIETRPGIVHVVNAPSPGATSSIAIGAWIAGRALAELES
jgi:(S)-2-hydroxyglutarate dehydrogenase